MPLTAFDHVNIRTANLDAMVAWYDDILGIAKGARPNFPVPGAWLYLGDRAVIHLIEADPAPMIHQEGESLRMEHVAFRATGMAGFTEKLDQRGIAYKLVPFDEIDTVLVFLRDPDGNRIHVDFPLSEMPAGT
jgi:catechol 2,3-dioxygenase-like lactoylglutathione lyase family enzyme